ALGDVPGGRAQLLRQPWTHWRDAILAELGAAHPDMIEKTERIDIVRYGHAMAVPVPGALAQVTRARAAARAGGARTEVAPLIFDDAPRLAFAHADWSGYSIFEEAFTLGDAAGAALA
ncbi:MAG: hypothetical protein JSS18_12395, partial [Proteobacteria bacterium]|nr:hypothetical protein [Pseudomonadota bacterium]